MPAQKAAEGFQNAAAKVKDILGGERENDSLTYFS